MAISFFDFDVFLGKIKIILILRQYTMLEKYNIFSKTYIEGYK